MRNQQRLRSAYTSTQYGMGSHLSFFRWPEGCKRHVQSVKTLIRLHGYAGWSETSLVAQVFLKVLSCAVSFILEQNHLNTLFIPHHTIVAGYSPPHNKGGVLWFHVRRPCVSLSVCCHTFIHQSIFCFWMITWVNINGFSPNLVCALILWISG